MSLLFTGRKGYFSKKMKAANPLHRSLVRIYLTVTFENILLLKRKCLNAIESQQDGGH